MNFEQLARDSLSVGVFDTLPQAADDKVTRKCCDSGKEAIYSDDHVFGCYEMKHTLDELLEEPLQKLGRVGAGVGGT
ncbi:hypothetical protein K7432_005702 [Basidiobolus ranarum]|uniref:Uncharacterized protein n=1 Tax=Basidiobolus ranarum TaxID=34480 RepID=A0ABR2WWA9_9FUNG